jgi:hypothetical protein
LSNKSGTKSGPRVFLMVPVFSAAPPPCRIPLLIILDPCIPSFTTHPARMSRHTTMPPLQNPLTHLFSPPTAMHAGARRLVAWWQMALSSLYSNSEV